MFLLKAYITILQHIAYIAYTHKFDIICILATYLDSSTPSDDNSLEIFGSPLV